MKTEEKTKAVIFKGKVLRESGFLGDIVLLKDDGQFYDSDYCHYNFWATDTSELDFWEHKHVEIWINDLDTNKNYLKFSGQSAYGYKIIKGNTVYDTCTIGANRFFDSIFSPFVGHNIEVEVKY